MNEDLKQIKSGNTIIGIGDSPSDDTKLIVIQDNAVQNWIPLTKEQVEKLIEYLINNKNEKIIKKIKSN